MPTPTDEDVTRLRTALAEVGYPHALVKLTDGKIIVDDSVPVETVLKALNLSQPEVPFRHTGRIPY